MHLQFEGETHLQFEGEMYLKNGGGGAWHANLGWAGFMIRLRIPKICAVYFAVFFPTRVSLLNLLQKIVFNWD